MQGIIISKVMFQMKIKCVMAVLVAAGVMMLAGCGGKAEQTRERGDALAALEDSLSRIAADCPGEVGIAVLTSGGDTLRVNDVDKYPLMSVFKLHQAIALCGAYGGEGVELDSVIEISRDELNPDTWSPMLKEHAEGDPALSVRELLRYTLMQSDNNASNLMFERLQGVAETDSFVATLIPRGSFRLSVTEAGMWGNHELCYENHSSPLGAALLIDRLFTDSIIPEREAEFIRTTLAECKTGIDRIVAPLAGIEGVTVAHKTGSGFRNEAGVLSAHNDVAFVTLPDGGHYTLAVLVKDFKGTEEDAAKVIARISVEVYRAVTSCRQACGTR